MRLGSLFTGAGGLDLGFERAGMTPVFQVEVDPYASKVLERHWPGVPRFGDIRHVQGRSLPACAALVGGFPCTNVSSAGDGHGLAGEESGLWCEFSRLVREILPRYVIVENSDRLNSRGLGTVLRDLAALGYDAEWQCLPAGAFGAPHLRWRCYVVAYAAGDGWAEGRAGRSAGSAEGQAAARLQPAPRVFREPPKPSSWWTHVPGVRRVAHGVPARVDEPRLRCCGHAVAVPVAEWLGRQVMRHAAARGAA